MTDPPEQNVVAPDGLIDTPGGALTVTETVAVAGAQPPGSVPVTVYVTEDAGAALTVAPVVALSPVEGDHV